MMRMEIRTSTALFMAVTASDGDDRPSGDQERRAAKEGLRVLIVEDEAIVAMNMETALGEAGFEVVSIVDTEADAIRAARLFRPDVIVMDIALRDGSGIRAAETIAKDVQAQIIFVSGNSDSGTLSAAFALKPAGFIRKPFLTERFALLVINAIESAQ